MKNENELTDLPENIGETENQNEEKLPELTTGADEKIDELPEVESVPELPQEPTFDEVQAVDSLPESESELTAPAIAPIELAKESVEEIEIEPLENFDAYNKTELTTRMEELCKEKDVNQVKTKVNKVREAFNQIILNDKTIALSKFLEDGNNEKDFESFPDTLEERFRKAYSKYTKLRSDFILGQEKLRKENLEIKKTIIQDMKNLIQNEDNMGKAFNEFHNLQARWRNAGPVPQQNTHDLWMNYKLYIDRFYDLIKINRELQNLDQKKNLEMKLHLCEKAEELILEPSLNKAIREAQRLTNNWKEIGFVSREHSNELWSRFKTALDKVYEHKKVYLEELRLQHNVNLEEKIKLCEQVETIANGVYEQHSDFQTALKSNLELQASWNKIGPADKVKNNEVWKRFRTAVDNFYKQKDVFYKKRKQEYAANLQGKIELCMQAEALKENSDWKGTADELKRLQLEWKKYGMVGSNEKNNKVWERFRAACDAFFSRKKDHFADKDSEQEKNYSLKLELIERVVKFAVNKEDAAGSLEQLKSFQREWSELGMVPLKKKDSVWESFRKAIQLHFDALNLRPDFRAGGAASYPVSTGNVAGNEKEIVLKMNKLKGEVMQLENNIEFFAKSKGPNLIKQEYEKKIQNSKDEIEKLKAKLKEIKNAN